MSAVATLQGWLYDAAGRKVRGRVTVGRVAYPRHEPDGTVIVDHTQVYATPDVPWQVEVPVDADYLVRLRHSDAVFVLKVHVPASDEGAAVWVTDRVVGELDDDEVGALAAHLDADDPHGIADQIAGQVDASVDGHVAADDPHGTVAAVVAHVGDGANPHGVTAGQVGALTPEAANAAIEARFAQLPTFYAPAPSGDITGVTDRVNVQAVLDAARLAGGGTILLGAGAYWVDRGEIANGLGWAAGGNCWLAGQGKGATKVTLAAGDYSGAAPPGGGTRDTKVIGNYSYNNGDNPIVISDLEIDGSKANVTGTGQGECINFLKVDGFAVLRCIVRNASQDGIDIDGCSDGIVAWNEVYDCGGSGVHTGLHDGVVSNRNLFVGNHTSGNGFGFQPEDRGGLDVFDGERNVFFGNVSVGDSNGIILKSHYNVVFGNVVTGADRQGVRITGGTRCVVAQNNLRNCGQWAIYLAPTGSAGMNTVVANNIDVPAAAVGFGGIRSAGIGTLVKGNVIQFAIGTGVLVQVNGHSSVEGNTFFQTGAGNAIKVEAAGVACSSNVYFRSSGTGAAFVLAANLCTVEGGRIEGAWTAGVEIDAAARDCAVRGVTINAARGSSAGAIWCKGDDAHLFGNAIVGTTVGPGINLVAGADNAFVTGNKLRGNVGGGIVNNGAGNQVEGNRVDA